MTEINIFEISSSPVVCDKATGSAGTGTPRKREKIFVRGSCATGANLVLSSYFPGLSGIDQIESIVTDDLKRGTTQVNVSGATVTFTHDGTVNCTLLGYY
jgi:hypothetical protein